MLEHQQATAAGDDGGQMGGQNSESTGAQGTSGNESSLSPEEEEYFREYSDMLATYKGQWTDIDLTGSLEPPKDLFIDVRVLKDAGEIQTEYGYVLPRLHDVLPRLCFSCVGKMFR